MSHCDRRMLAIGFPAALLLAGAAGLLSQMALDAWSLWIGPFAVGFVAGVTVAWLGVRFRCRRLGLVLSLGVAAAAAGNAASWWEAVRHAEAVGLVWRESQRDVDLRETEDLVLHGIHAEQLPQERGFETARPRGLGEYMSWRFRHGWPERGEEASAPLVAFLFAGELILSVFLAVAILSAAILAKPFCRTHQQWAARVLTVFVGDVDPLALSQAARASDIDAIVEPPKSKGSRCAARFLFYRCGACDSTRLTLTLLRRRQEETLLEEVPVTEGQIQACCQSLARVPRTG